jgi:hypothetical protein
MSELDEFKDKMTKELYGMTRAEALRHGICVSCKERAIPKCYSHAGLREYKISGLCEKCFDEIFKEPEDGQAH